MTIETSTCCTDSLFKRVNDGTFRLGFMGPAHAASAGALMMVIALLGVANDWGVWSTATIAIILQSFLVAAGSGLVPDLDNTRSTSHSSLWIVGSILSVVMRGSSRVLQTVIRTKKDSTTPNPHRGFWHTMVGAGIIGAGAFLIAGIESQVTVGGIDTTWGRLSAVILSAVLTHIALAGVAGATVKKIKKASILGELAAGAISVGITAVLFSFIPSSESYYWIAWAIFIGCTAHIIGDCFTKAGAPIFFPLTAITRKKFWWVTRFGSASADNEGVNKAIIKVSEVVSVISLGGILYFTFFA